MSDFTISLLAFFVCVTIIIVSMLYVYLKKNTHTKGYFAFALLTAFSSLTLLVLVTLWTNQAPWATAIGFVQKLLGIPYEPAERLSPVQIGVTLLLWAGAGWFFWKLYEMWSPEVVTPAISKKLSMSLSVQVGKRGARTWLPQEERLGKIKSEQNPYVSGAALAANSSVFVGREREVERICAALRRVESPESVSVLGERRMGKSSLLNQVVVSLAADEKMLVLHLCAQEWQVESVEELFGQWHRAFAEALGVRVRESGYAVFGDFLREQARR
ncbi:MAG: ATP-binding protein, partial [Myxococcota bacterium]